MKHNIHLQRFAACLSAFALTGCAGLKSSSVKPESVKGVAYHLPMKAFVLTVTRAGGVTTKLDWAESPPIPDVRTTFNLEFTPHWIGKTTIDVGVAPNGLLGRAHTATTSSIAELAKIQPKTMALAAQTREDAKKCPADGAFAFFLFKPGKGEACGDVKFDIQPIPASAERSEVAPFELPEAPSSAPDLQGVYYRQSRPYIASATSGAQLATRLLSVPNESPTMALPFGRTLFAANDGKMTLEDGMLTSYQQSDEGEFVALLQFPATILSAYFTAVGNVFTAFSAKEAKDAELQIKEFKLEALQAKLAKCKAALDINDATAMTTLGCASLSVN